VAHLEIGPGGGHIGGLGDGSHPAGHGQFLQLKLNFVYVIQ